MFWAWWFGLQVPLRHLLTEHMSVKVIQEWMKPHTCEYCLFCLFESFADSLIMWQLPLLLPNHLLRRLREWNAYVIANTLCHTSSFSPFLVFSVSSWGPCFYKMQHQYLSLCQILTSCSLSKIHVLPYRLWAPILCQSLYHPDSDIGMLWVHQKPEMVSRLRHWVGANWWQLLHGEHRLDCLVCTEIHAILWSRCWDRHHRTPLVVLLAWGHDGYEGHHGTWCTIVQCHSPDLAWPLAKTLSPLYITFSSCCLGVK